VRRGVAAPAAAPRERDGQREHGRREPRPHRSIGWTCVVTVPSSMTCSANAGGSATMV